MPRSAPKVIAISICMLAAISSGGVAHAANSTDTSSTSATSSKVELKNNQNLVQQESSSQTKSSGDVLVSADKTNASEVEQSTKSSLAKKDSTQSTLSDKTETTTSQQDKSAALANTAQKDIIQPAANSVASISKVSADRLVTYLKSHHNTRTVYRQSEVSQPTNISTADSLPASKPSSSSKSPNPLTNLAVRLQGLMALSLASLIPGNTGSATIHPVDAAGWPMHNQIIPVILSTLAIVLLAYIVVVRKNNHFHAGPRSDLANNSLANLFGIKITKRSVAYSHTPILFGGSL